MWRGCPHQTRMVRWVSHDAMCCAPSLATAAVTGALWPISSANSVALSSPQTRTCRS